jgi:prolipoprotein diacylglyceryltransferase
MPEPRQLHRASTRVLSSLMVLVGLGLVVSTLVRGGGPLAVGLVVGVLFCGVGVGRLWLERGEP